MKRFLLFVLAVITVFSLVACGEQNKPEKTSGEPAVKSGEVTTTPEPADLPDTQNDELYESVTNDYKAAFAFFSLDDVDGIEKLEEECKLVSSTLVAHICRYSDDGAELTYDYYDIDKNGVDELIVGASKAPGAIYSYDKTKNVPVIVFFQDTMERGNLSIYDNGVIFSEGAGGAALHFYRFGKINPETLEFEELAMIQEEYTEGKEEPTYTDFNTEKVLEYKSLDEIMNVYVADAKKVEF